MKQLSSALVLLVLVGVGCSSDERERAEALQDRSIAGATKPLREALIPESQVRGLPADSPERAFLEFWGLAQYQAWAAAVDSYDVGLRTALGSDRIVEALKTQASYFRTTRPRLRGVVRQEGRATVRYVVETSSGDVIPNSITWTRTDGQWRIFHDPFLDEALRAAAQRVTQIRVDPTKDEIGPAATRSGDAASRLQSEYLRERLDQAPTESP